MIEYLLFPEFKFQSPPPTAKKKSKNLVLDFAILYIKKKDSYY